jgi:hypothetical protein
MAGGLAVTTLGYRLVFRRGSPLFAGKFNLPTQRQIDLPLVGGAALFGVAWGGALQAFARPSTRRCCNIRTEGFSVCCRHAGRNGGSARLSRQAVSQQMRYRNAKSQILDYSSKDTLRLFGADERRASAVHVQVWPISSFRCVAKVRQLLEA